jgi:hypothetical protein
MTARRKAKPDPLDGYEPLKWDADSTLGPEEQQTIEEQRRDMWRKGLRGALLEQLAFEFAAVICMRRAAKAAGFRA